MGWMAKVRFPAEAGIFPFVIASRPVLGPTMSSILRVPGVKMAEA